MEFKTADDFLYQNYESHQYNIDNEIFLNKIKSNDDQHILLATAQKIGLNNISFITEN